MVFVPVISPDKNSSINGITWWEDQDANGDYFRSFAQWFESHAGIDRNRIWTIGYSGGAEFQSFELNSDQQESWRSGGGSIMVGGGGYGQMQTIASENFKAQPMYWFVGKNDGIGVTWPHNWSALGAARSGYTNYRNQGFWNTQITYTEGDHYAYNFPWILETSLSRAGVQKRNSSTVNGFKLQGAIGNYYWSKGGPSALGNPTTNEFSVTYGGVAQEFSSNSTIYWHPSIATARVWFSGGIGARYRQLGYENGIGYPLFDETAISGGAVQKFKIPNGGVTALYWAAHSGRTVTVWEPGGIGRKFTAGGGTGAFGFPVEDETVYSYGARQVFERGWEQSRFYWSPATGTHVMNGRGGIFWRWAGKGAANTVGFPSSDELGVRGGGAIQFFRNRSGFESAFIWSPNTGTHVLSARGGLYFAWLNHGHTDKYGFPSSDETANSDGSYFVDFSKGYRLTWTPDGRITESRI
ncbi:LGFP repeat-containing protein [Rothia sp. P5764]|uniref:LGFP repeat-containing protein n=1 Tax=Rothia sp. P5764 TaxID=3402654 RepID=UPI003AC6BC11